MKNILVISMLIFILAFTGCGSNKSSLTSNFSYDEEDIGYHLSQSEFQPINKKEIVNNQDVTFSIASITTSRSTYDTGKKQIAINFDLELNNNSKSTCDLSKFLQYSLLSLDTKQVFEETDIKDLEKEFKSGADIVKPVSFDITSEFAGNKGLYIVLGDSNFIFNFNISEKGAIKWLGEVIDISVNSEKPSTNTEYDPLIFNQKPGVYYSKINLEINNIPPKYDIFYTLDGSEPSKSDNKYAGNINLNEGANNVVAIMFDQDGSILQRIEGLYDVKPDEEVIFEDKMLETMVRKHLGKSRSETLRSSELALVEQLFIYDKFIYGLDDVKSFKGTKLFFKNDYIDQYGDMSSYDDMSITTFRDLKYFINLKALFLQKSRYDYDGNGDGNTQLSIDEILTEINELPNAGGLTHLCINTESNTFRNKGSLDKLPDMSNLSNIEFLDLAYNNIVNIESVARLKKLRLLNLRMNYIADISPLSELTQLQELYLGYNKLGSLKELANLEELYVLAAEDQNFDQDTQGYNNFDFDIICDNLANLKMLNLSSTGINDITGISKLTNLEVLELAHVDIDNYNKYLDQLYAAPKLEILAVTGQIDKKELDKIDVTNSLVNYDPHLHPWDYIFTNRAILMDDNKW